MLRTILQRRELSSEKGLAYTQHSLETGRQDSRELC